MAVCLAGSTGLCAQPVLYLKGRAGNAAQTAELAAGRSLHGGRVHRIVQFAFAPTAAQLEEVRQKGGRILQYVPENGLLVSGPRDWESGGLAAHAMELLRVEDKLSLPEAGPAVLEFTEPRLSLVVEFHLDVTAGEARQILALEQVEVVQHPDLAATHQLVKATRAEARRLAGWDEVAYVFPASRALEEGLLVHVCAGAVTLHGPVGQYVSRIGEGWDGPGLHTADLTYTLQALTENLPQDAVREEILKALVEWSRYVGVNFSEAAPPGASRNINILFAAGAHGDPYPFDGPGRALAHTFYPAPPNPEPIAGDLHFDAAESWRMGNDVDVYSVALHEMGHALGLGHSDKPGSVMYPYYRLATTLTEEDIDGIRQLYATRDPAVPPPQPPALPPTVPPQPPVTPPVNPPAPAPAPPPSPPTPPGDDTTAPSLTIASPSTTSVLTAAESITIRGKTTDNVGVTQVFWTSSAGKTGIAAGTAEWIIVGLPLLRGTNNIVVRAMDEAGNSSWRSLVVRRQ